MKTAILDYLKMRGCPVRRLDLLNYLHSLSYDITERQLRKTIEEMITHDGELIASGFHGYSLIQTYEEMEAARKYLNEHIESCAVRRNMLLHSWNKRAEAEGRRNELLLFQ